MVEFTPLGRRVSTHPGESVLDAAQEAGIVLAATCGGMGTCGTCKVRLVSGLLRPVTLEEREQLSADELAAGMRLACQAEPLSDVRVEVFAAVQPQMQLDGAQTDVALQPAVHAVDVQLVPPGLSDLRSDLERLQAALPHPLTAPLAALRQAAEQARLSDFALRLALRTGDTADELVAALPPATPLLGLAVDLGSTKLAVYLVDLSTGSTLASKGVMNPQIAYGEDVVSRIAYANRGEAQRLRLQACLMETLNTGVAELCAHVGASTGQIVDVVVAGNTAMHHFFCGLPVRQLGSAPYVPVVRQPLNVSAAELGLHFAPGAQVYLPANIAGYVGGDHTAALLASHRADGRAHVLVDIGTNTEISLITGSGRILSCSCASGPAFEGAHIRDGMRAAPGAIDRVRVLADGILDVGTIDGAAPIGLCGTGIVQAVAEMVRAGVVDGRGVLRRNVPGVVGSGGHAAFVLVPAEASASGREIAVTRADVHEIQLAKSAIRAGIELLLTAAGMTALDVDEWDIAGAFGSTLNLTDAMHIGLLPRVPLERYVTLGNAAGAGARQMLLNVGQRAVSQRLAEQAEYIELTTTPGFTDAYVEAMTFENV